MPYSGKTRGVAGLRAVMPFLILWYVCVSGVCSGSFFYPSDHVLLHVVPCGLG